MAALTSNAFSACWKLFETPCGALVETTCAGASLEASASMKKPVTADAPRLPKSRINFRSLTFAAGSAVTQHRVEVQEVPSVLPRSPAS